MDPPRIEEGMCRRVQAAISDDADGEASREAQLERVLLVCARAKALGAWLETRSQSVEEDCFGDRPGPHDHALGR